MNEDSSSDKEEKKQKPKEEIDTRAIIRQLYAMHQELEEKLQYIDQNIHHLPKELVKLAQQPEKIVEGHQKLVEKYEKDLEDKVVGVLGKSLYFGYKKSVEKKKGSRGRKSQRLRGRKKWIPLR